MTGKNLYDILGVPRNATPEQIRKAYLLRSKVLHPDRFDQTRQPTEWQLANEMVKDLNNAYSILSDSLERADYDRAFFGQSNAGNSQPKQQPQNQSQTQNQQTRQPPRPDVKLGNLKSGIADFESLPPSIQKRIKRRVSGQEKQQFGVRSPSIAINYILAVLLLGWFWLLFGFANSDNRWDSDSTHYMLAATGVCAFFQALNINWIVNWHFSPLRCWLLVTPIYIIKTRLDKIWFWPIWEITDIKSTHNYLNGIYTGTSFSMSFKEHTESLRLSTRKAWESLTSTLSIFDRKIRSAKNQGDWSYFFEEDDFREYNPENAKPVHRPRRRMAAVFGATFLLYGIVFAIASSVNGNQPVSYATNLRAPGNPSPEPSVSESPKPFVPPAADQIVVPPPFSEPELELPANGETVAYTDGERLAPFEIKSSYGSDYLVKLADYYSGQTVMTVFVRSGETVNINVPLGSYAVKYAAGSKWYGYKYLFGPETGYSKASDIFTFQLVGDTYEGFTITLYEVPNGNLHTEKIKPEQF